MSPRGAFHLARRARFVSWRKEENGWKQRQRNKSSRRREWWMRKMDLFSMKWLRVRWEGGTEVWESQKALHNPLGAGWGAAMGGKQGNEMTAKWQRFFSLWVPVGPHFQAWNCSLPDFKATWRVDTCSLVIPSIRIMPPDTAVKGYSRSLMQEKRRQEQGRSITKNTRTGPRPSFYLSPLTCQNQGNAWPRFLGRVKYVYQNT